MTRHNSQTSSGTTSTAPATRKMGSPAPLDVRHAAGLVLYGSVDGTSDALKQFIRLAKNDRSLIEKLR